MTIRKSTLFYMLLATTIFCVDRITKMLALTYLHTGEYRINQFISFDLVMNRGVSWSLFHSSHSIVFILLTIIIMGIISGLIIYAWHRLQQEHIIIGELCVLSGALSNVVDRFLYGGVIDFILISWHRWSWPVFNIADISIVVGIGIMLLTLYKE